MTRYEAYVLKGWREHGLTPVFVARLRGDASADYGVFLVDIWCLGVKDAWGESDVPEPALREFLDEHVPESARETIHPTCAKKLIEGAAAYAERLGFAPHRDFRKARRVLSGLDAALCPTEFTFGREGRVCFVPGPDDSDERVNRVLAILDARVGPEGYDYEPEEDEEDEIAALREALIEFLAAEPAEVPRFYRLSGLLTALHLCPKPVALENVNDALWPEGREWEDEEEAENFAAMLQEYWDYLGERVREATTPDAPPEATVIDVWRDDLPKQKEGEDYDPLSFMAALIEWASGFQRATELWPEAWADVLERPELAPHWEMIRWWSEFIDYKDDIDAAAEANPPRNIGQAVKALAHALQTTRPAGGDSRK